MKRLLQVCEAEKVTYDDSGIDALVFTAQGDMRQVMHLIFLCIVLIIVGSFFLQIVYML